MTSTAALSLEREDGWREIDEGWISADKLRGWIKEYFNIKEDLAQFKSRNGGQGLEVVNQDNSRGYVFVGSLQLERDFENRMEKIMQWYQSGNRRIFKKFTDYEEQLAGFSWRRE